MSAALHLKAVLLGLGLSQSLLADETKIPRPRISQLVNHGIWPAGIARALVRKAITRFIKKRGGSTRGLFAPARHQAGPHPAHTKKKPPSRANATGATPPSRSTNSSDDDEVAMLLRKKTLLPATRAHFQLPRDPFVDPSEQADVYLNSELRYVRESMYQAARHGGFMAVIGESGAGKTTLLEELVSRIEREEQAVICVRPYVLASEAQDVVGKTLRAHHIAEAIMSDVAPLAKTKSSPEARFRQLHQSLRDSARAGHSHVLLIDEAHSLPLPTLKHLKRFLELKDGMRRLLSIVLFGQPELGVKLSEHNPEVREVVQRIEILNLPPLGQDLEAYLKHRFSRVGADLSKVMARDAIDALREKLTPTRAGPLLYPLAVANALTAAMNRAAEYKQPLVTADVIKTV